MGSVNYLAILQHDKRGKKSGCADCDQGAVSENPLLEKTCFAKNATVILGMRWLVSCLLIIQESILHNEKHFSNGLKTSAF